MSGLPHSIARLARRAVLTGFELAGINNVAGRSQWRRQRLLILCYHGVSLSDEHDWNSSLFVTPEFLRRRFEAIRKSGCEVLPLSEATRRLRDGSLPRCAVVLTFDDGFHNFDVAAMPLLAEYSFPATVYISTYYCIHQRPILGLTLRYFLWRARNRGRPPDFGGPRRDGDLKDPRVRQLVGQDLLEIAKSFSEDRAAETTWLASVAAALGVDWNEFEASRILHLMSEAQIRAIASRGVDVQLHTHRHLASADPNTFRTDLLENRAILEALTKRPATHFCYPSGDYRPDLVPLLQGLGVVSATTCDAGLAGPGTDPLFLPRFIDTMSQSDSVFSSWLSGMASAVSGRGR